MLLKHNLVSTVNNGRRVTWSAERRGFLFSKLVNRGFIDTIITNPFALDIWRGTVGWETWVGEGDARERQTVEVPLHLDMPAKPTAKSKNFYAIPIYSTEINGRGELLLKEAAQGAALNDLFNSIEADIKEFEGAALCVPVIATAARDTDDFGVAPVFSLVKWMERPTHWAPATVIFHG